MLGMSLLPTLSHAALGLAGSELSIEVCTTTGIASIASSEAQADVDRDGAPQAEPTRACSWCLAHAGFVALPPAATAPVFATVPAPGFPRAFYQSPHRRTVWSTPQSRAPPG